MLANCDAHCVQRFATAHRGLDRQRLTVIRSCRRVYFQLRQVIQVDSLQLQLCRRRLAQAERKDLREIRQRAYVQAIVVARAATSDRVGDSNPVGTGVREGVRQERIGSAAEILVARQDSRLAVDERQFGVQDRSDSGGLDFKNQGLSSLDIELKNIVVAGSGNGSNDRRRIEDLMRFGRRAIRFGFKDLDERSNIEGAGIRTPQRGLYAEVIPARGAGLVDVNLHKQSVECEKVFNGRSGSASGPDHRLIRKFNDIGDLARDTRMAELDGAGIRQVGAFDRQSKSRAALHAGRSNRSNGGRTQLGARRRTKYEESYYD